jgi:hypothetical protein
MNSILFVEDWNQNEDLPKDAFAVTLVWNLVKTGEIVDADMLLNPTLGSLSICGQTCPRSPIVVDVQNVITHEAGHFLGLAHSDIVDATMSATAPVGETQKRTLQNDDVEGICSIYGSLPEPMCTDNDFVPPRGFSAKCSTGRTSKACTLSAPGATSSTSPLLALGLLLGAFLLVRRRAR